MLNLEGLSCHTGTVERIGSRVAIKYRGDDRKLKTCFLNATTQFLGPIDNRLALKSLFDGLGVNVWLRGRSAIVTYAAPNWR